MNDKCQMFQIQKTAYEMETSKNTKYKEKTCSYSYAIYVCACIIFFNLTIFSLLVTSQVKLSYTNRTL